MKPGKRFLLFIIVFLVYMNGFSQETTYTVLSHLSGFQQSALPDKKGWIFSRAAQPVMGEMGNSSAVIITDAAMVRTCTTGIVMPADFSDPEGPYNTPGDFRLDSNYPNPFNFSTTVCYTLPEPVNVTCTIYRINGRKVMTLLNERQTAGEKIVVWNGTDESGRVADSGVYLFRIRAGERVKSIKMILIK